MADLHTERSKTADTEARLRDAEDKLAEIPKLKQSVTTAESST